MIALAAAVGATQALAQGGGSSGSSGEPGASKAAKKKGTLVKVEKTRFGKALVNRSGRVFYLFDLEKGTTPECYDQCARAWPPVFTKGKPRAGKGAKQGKLGTTKRTDGRTQVTYGGHPLYYYEHDTPDKILCQHVFEFGGLWLLVKPGGGAIR